MTSFSKGSVYYKKRIVTEDEGIVFAYEYLICPKCKYKVEQHEKRYKEFQKRCNHPKKFIDTEWHYISGESVKEPYYEYCRLCGEISY
ncbi:hypothetical protein [Clostridium senegalense]|uniref:hypothetical protein n=1 Tax=Clostridium senegalense TaxID=1465809 RepID=UPI00030E2953|nr:hypothetical protein [Clostridium senegalense]